ncbi:dihydropyrimidinase [Microbispora amethystogenes]|uniref:D-hydantoinase n=1 Tax=Microbispora amethystogenes TaxID=1427754 RepID=A0ABQ4F6W3_9ACTN|nr:dihydropyrimidinase [Microbispora amethystogenes]GIH30547.1 D-hydantoinase [Microbispora amethystogenes]
MGSTLIRGGTVVNADAAVRADVLVRDGVVAALGDGAGWAADEVVEATGRLVLPGGIDVHTHLEYPIDGFTTRTADDFHSGTAAAAHGGTTTVVDFVKKEPGASLRDSYLRRRDVAAAKSFVDFGLHAIVPPRDQQEDVLDDLRLLAGEGATSWKFFMAYPGTQMVDDGQLLEGFELAAEYGVLPMVHAENGHMVERETRRLVGSGRVSESFHALAHGHDSEAEAVHRAVVLAESAGTPLYVVHVSSARAAEEIGAARAGGARVWGETCPQYLAVAYEDYAGLGERAAAYVCSPPIRERANQEGLWRALQTGALSTVATDHAGFCMEQPDDLPPQKLRSPGYFPKVPNGVPGVEDRLMVLWETGVRTGRIDMCRFVDLVATRPAKLFGLFPRKGLVAAGADADLVVWDPEADHVITAAGSHLRTDYNLYEGMRVTGRPVHVFSRGHHLVNDGALEGGPGRGAFLTRGAPHLF